LLEKARSTAADHEWLQASMAGLERLASRRDRSMFAKEARFKSTKLMSRLVASSEVNLFSVAEESQVPRFLRRKSEEGRSDPS
jgi:Ca-activated chloride channel family protein